MVAYDRAERVQLTYENRSKRYLYRTPISQLENPFSIQYCHYYNARLEALRPRIVDSASQQLGTFKEMTVEQLTTANPNESVLVIGTIKKRQAVRPSVLKELAHGSKLDAEANEDGEAAVEDDGGVEFVSFARSDDFLELEDEKQIVRLSGGAILPTDSIATGVVIGVLGKALAGGQLEVERVIFPSSCPQRPLKRPKSGVLAIVSGLLFTGNAVEDRNTLLAFSEFVNFVRGDANDYDDAQKVARVLIAGESVAVPTLARDYNAQTRYQMRNAPTPHLQSISFLDKFLGQLTCTVEVDLMTGQNDPASQLWPQQPIHWSTFSKAVDYGRMLTPAPNPYEFTLEGVDICATSGGSIADLRRLGTPGQSSELMAKLLRWQHLAPTVPDTLDGFPFKDCDPLVLSDRFPHIFIAGNAPAPDFESISFDNGASCLCVAVPRFSLSRTAAFIDLATGEVALRTFGDA